MNKLRLALATERGQTIMGVLYSLGASVVIIGALFKILHLPGAEFALMLGMGTEAFLFAMGALEFPHKAYDWGIVFPALNTPHGEEPPADAPLKGHLHPQAEAQSGDLLKSLVESGELSADDVKKLADGIKKLNKTAAGIGDIASTEGITKEYVKNLSTASNNVAKLAEVQGKSAEEIHEATSSLHSASKELVSSYSKLSSSMEVEMKVVRDNSEESQKELVNFNKNLAAINAVYEIQLNYANQQVDALKSQIDTMAVMGKEVESIKKVFSSSLDDTEAYKVEASKLKNSIAELNNVYGNMLSALSING